MTENKRFDWDMNGIFDYENDDEDYISEYEDLSDLLNEQEEVITNLRLSIEVTGKAYRKSVKDYEEFIEELEKENVQLKEIKERYDETIVDWNALKSEYDDLKNENEQLKKEIRVVEKAKDSFYDKVEGLLTEHIEYNQLKPENMDSVIKALNELKMEIFE